MTRVSAGELELPQPAEDGAVEACRLALRHLVGQREEQGERQAAGAEASSSSSPNRSSRRRPAWTSHQPGAPFAGAGAGHGRFAPSSGVGHRILVQSAHTDDAGGPTVAPGSPRPGRSNFRAAPDRSVLRCLCLARRRVVAPEVVEYCGQVQLGVVPARSRVVALGEG